MVDEDPLEGPRTRGHRKKEKTRRQLLAAGLRVLNRKGESLTARDVTAEADVSTGTFYNYFADPDALIDAIMRDQLLGIAATTAHEPIPDPALRVAVTATRVLQRALADPRWARLALRLVHRPGEPNQLNHYLRDDLVEGFEQGRFQRAADDATLDQATGLLVMTIRRIVAGGAGPEVVPRMVERLLEAFGVSEDEASELAATASSP
ncbi:MAG: TetR/AcrR family transcriptional regulator [Myxococcota bacterium]|nr:TetR/AcrR family transcriptional regulator [Myxococcota bacterium]